MFKCVIKDRRESTRGSKQEHFLNSLIRLTNDNVVIVSPGKKMSKKNGRIGSKVGYGSIPVPIPIPIPIHKNSNKNKNKELRHNNNQYNIMNHRNNILSSSPSMIISIVVVVLIVTVTVTAINNNSNNNNGEGNINNKKSNEDNNNNSNEWKLHILDADAYPMATCPDGSQGAYYVREGNSIDTNKADNVNDDDGQYANCVTRSNMKWGSTSIDDNNDDATNYLDWANTSYFS